MKSKILRDGVESLLFDYTVKLGDMVKFLVIFKMFTISRLVSI